MKDLIINSCANKFVEANNIVEKDEAVRFEHFANFCVVSKHCPDLYQEDPQFYEEVHTGNGGDYAVDGILLLVNDMPVSSLNQLDEIKSKKLRVKIVFVQAKTEDAFKSGDILKTGNGVLQILKGDKERANAGIVNYIDILQAVYSRSIQFESKPECYIYYVTLGTWTADSNLQQAADKVCADINELHLTCGAEFIPIDSDKLHTMYREITQSVTKTVEMVRTVPFPIIEGVREAYLGLVRLKDLVKLITDENGVLYNNLFYENVRCFLGYNPVNKEIRETICSETGCVHFPILNNGITIVAKELHRVGDRFTMSDFQIVNGCQTCNVVYDCRANLRDDVYCTIKIIGTDNVDVISEVVKSTNKQSVIKDEAFETLRPIHKQIQAYFEAVDVTHRLYYERRAREFSTNVSLDRRRVVSLTTLLNSYLSVFQDWPHCSHRYYGELLESYIGKVFQDNDKPILYYTAAWCLYRVDCVLFSKKEYLQVRRFRYHFAMLIAHLAAKRPAIIRPSSRETEKYCNNVCSAVNDDKVFQELMAKACEIMMEAIRQQPEIGLGNGNTRRKQFTDTLLSLVYK